MPAADGKMYKNNSRLRKKTIRRNKDYGLEVRLNLLRVNFYRLSYKKNGNKFEKSAINYKSQIFEYLKENMVQFHIQHLRNEITQYKTSTKMLDKAHLSREKVKTDALQNRIKNFRLDKLVQ